MSKDKKIQPPPLKDSFAEGARCVSEYLTLKKVWDTLCQTAPLGNGSPVLVLPGFGADDHSTRWLRRFLTKQGYTVYGWDGGVNKGFSKEALDHTKKRFDEICQKHPAQKLALVGHSLGGLSARELARDFPSQVSKVITMGSPFNMGTDDDAVQRLTRLIFDHYNADNDLISNEMLRNRSRVPPPVPTTSIYSQTDGFVNWRTCINPPGQKVENVEVESSHLGMAVNALVFLVIADRLAQPIQNWRPFDPAKYPRAVDYFKKEQAHHKYIPKKPPPPKGGKPPPKLFD